MTPIPWLNDFGQQLVANLGPLSLELVLWAGVVFLLLRALRIHSPALRHLGWVLVLLKPLTSVLWQSPLPLYTLPPPNAVVLQSAPADLETGDLSPPEPTTPQPSAHTRATLDPLGVLALLWLGTGAILILRLIAGHLLLSRLRRRAEPVHSGPLHQALMDAASTLGVRRQVHLALTDHGGPLVTGILHPLILLPRHLTGTLSPDQLSMVFAHELVHVRRLDNLFLLVQQLVEAAFFFHPIIWLCRRGLRLEAEKACDDAVLRSFPQPPLYADSLVRVAELQERRLQGQWLNTFAAAESRLGQRVTRILGAPLRSPSRRLALGAVLALSLIAFIGLPAFLGESPTQADEAKGPAPATHYRMPEIPPQPPVPVPYLPPEQVPFRFTSARESIFLTVPLNKWVEMGRNPMAADTIYHEMSLSLVDMRGEQTRAGLEANPILRARNSTIVEQSREIALAILRDKTNPAIGNRDFRSMAEARIIAALNEKVFAPLFPEHDPISAKGLVRVQRIGFGYSAKPEVARSLVGLIDWP